MTAKLQERMPLPTEERPGPQRGSAWLAWLALGVALLLPCCLSLVDFVLLAKSGGANLAQQLAYGFGQAFLLVFPLLCVVLLERRRPRFQRPTVRGALLGIAFGLVVVAGMLGLYFVFLRDTPVFGSTAAMLGEKLREFGLASPAGFALFAFFITVLHSLLEEYYWRWFVFGWLRQRWPLWLAMAVSSLAFMAHHVVVLDVYFPGQFWIAVVPFSLCTAVGGAAWAWLYDRTGSIYSPWLSHLVVDAGLFVIGYDLFFVRGA